MTNSQLDFIIIVIITIIIILTIITIISTILIRGGVAEKETIKSAFFIGYVVMQVDYDLIMQIKG